MHRRILLHPALSADRQVAYRDGVGVIDTGYEGSFVVLDRNIFTIDPDEIDQVQVAETWLRGERVYQRPAG